MPPSVPKSEQPGRGLGILMGGACVIIDGVRIQTRNAVCRAHHALTGAVQGTGQGLQERISPHYLLVVQNGFNPAMYWGD